MSVYKKLAALGSRFMKPHQLFKTGFNLSPMYRRSTGRILSVTPDLLHVRIRIPISYKNRNYVNSIYGGSMFSATDPIYMIQYIHLLGDAYVVWDKSAQIFFKKPAREDLYADFILTETELQQVRDAVARNGETEVQKTAYLTDQSGSVIYCEVRKIIYIAGKEYFKEKKKRQASKPG